MTRLVSGKKFFSGGGKERAGARDGERELRRAGQAAGTQQGPRSTGPRTLGRAKKEALVGPLGSEAVGFGILGGSARRAEPFGKCFCRYRSGHRLERRAWDSNPQPVARQLISNQSITPKNTEENADSGNSAAPGAATKPFPTPFDADLRSIIDAWPDLPNALKAGIAAMVKSWKTTGPS
jgi:hypothetical protein